MTPEEIKKDALDFVLLCSKAGPGYRTPANLIAQSQVVALYEIALQLAEMNARGAAKTKDYNIPGVDGVPPTKESAASPAVSHSPE